MNALSEALCGARRVVFFGGAGVSVPSGIPDFRGENGLYAREYDGLTAEMLLSHSFFCLHPDIFYDFYKINLFLSFFRKICFRSPSTETPAVSRFSDDRKILPACFPL